MDSTLKFGLITALFGALVYGLHKATQKASEWTRAIAFRVVDFGLPTFGSGQLAVPLVVRITNNSPLMAPIQNVLVLLSVLRNNSWVAFGQINSGPFTLHPGTSNHTFLASKLNPFGASGNQLQTITQVLLNQNPVADVKIDTTVQIEGVALPTHTERKPLYLKQLLALAA